MTAEPMTSEPVEAPRQPAMAPSHQCSPRILTRMWDGGRLAMVCPTCSVIVGYDDASYVGTLNVAYEEIAALRAASVQLHGAVESLRVELTEAQREHGERAQRDADRVTGLEAELAEALARPVGDEPDDEAIAARWRTCSRAEAIRQAEAFADATRAANRTIESLRAQLANVHGMTTEGGESDDEPRQV